MSLATVAIFVLGAVAAACFYAAGYQHARRQSDPQAVSDGFWRGYWVGQRDGHAAAVVIERTPSPN